MICYLRLIGMMFMRRGKNSRQGRVLPGGASSVIKFKVVFSSKARKFYETCPNVLAQRLNVCFLNLENDPYRGPNIKKLKTRAQESLYRYRIGDYRVIYEILAHEVVVLIVKIAPRGDVYRDL